VSGHVELSGDSSQAISTGAMVTEMSARTANVAWNIRGSTKHIEVEEFSLDDGHGRLSAEGYLDRTDNLRWHFDAEANGFDPSMFASGWPGSIDMSVATEGELTEAAPSGSIRVKELRGALRGRALSGSGTLKLTQDKRVEGELELRSGDAHLRIVGQREKAVNLLAELNLPSLSEWHPQASGSVRSQFRARGRWPRLSVEGSARAMGIQWQEFRATSISLELDGRGPSRPSGRVSLEAAEVLAKIATFSVVTAQLAGSEREHTLEVRVAGRPLTFAGLARGALIRNRWSGSLAQFDLDVQDATSVSLQAPASIELSRSRVSISESCLAGGEMKLCLAGDWQRGGAAQVAYSIRELPLNLIARMAFRDESIAVDGTLQGKGDLRREATGAGSGTAQLTSAAGGVTRLGERGASFQFHDLALQAKLNGGTASAEVSATLGQSGSLGANISFADLQTSDPTLKGGGSIRVADLSGATALLSELSNLRGAAEAAFTIEGPVRTPSIAANASITALQTEVPALGLKLHDGALTFRMQPREGLQMSGQVTSGAGVLKVNGAGQSATSFTVGIEGNDVTALDIPGALVVIAPHLHLAQTSQTTTLAGTLDVPRADVDLESFAARSNRRISPDVVVVGRKIEIEKAATAMNADVNVAFGKNVKLKGFGLDGQISGAVRVKEVAARNSTGYGQLEVAGTYEVYGRKLDIERARLVFADTSLDDPQLDVLATRKLPEATINVSVTGTAQHPKLAISSDDDMTQTEALSYLLTGKPPDELRQDEGAMLQSAKSSLGTMVGDQLARRFGQKIGVDNIGVEENADLGSSALTIGKYLSPRFFVSYGVALFEPGSVMTVRYTINDKVSVKANQAPDSQHAGIEYRIER
jgi:translocation and assembly module TamB